MRGDPGVIQHPQTQLKNEQARLETGAAQHLRDPFAQVGLLELPRRQVDRHDDGRLRVPHLPLDRRDAGLLEDPVAERQHEPGVLGDVHEVPGPEQPCRAP